MKKRVITISRQFGSGGHCIGKSVAEQLGIPYYDKEILGRIASETGFALSFIENASEYATSNNSFLWNLVMKHSSPHVPEENPADVIYFTQAKIIKEIAGKESCVNIIPLGSHQFPASEPPGNGIFHLQSHHNILWQHTYLISL